VSASTLRIAPTASEHTRARSFVAGTGQRGRRVRLEQSLSGQSHVIEDQIGGAAVIDCAVGMHGEATRGSGGIEFGEEQCVVVGGPRRDQQVGSQRRSDDDDLRTRNEPVITVANSCGGQPIPAIAGVGIRCGEGDDRRSCGHLREYRGRSLAAGTGQESAGNDHRIDEWFDYQCAAEFLGDHHGLGAATTAAAGRLG
jgi:hypothetical protein